jgi:hypothetical protein
MTSTSPETSMDRDHANGSVADDDIEGIFDRLMAPEDAPASARNDQAPHSEVRRSGETETALVVEQSKRAAAEIARVLSGSQPPDSAQANRLMDAYFIKVRSMDLPLDEAAAALEHCLADQRASIAELGEGGGEAEETSVGQSVALISDLERTAAQGGAFHTDMAMEFAARLHAGEFDGSDDPIRDANEALIHIGKEAPPEARELRPFAARGDADQATVLQKEGETAMRRINERYVKEDQSAEKLGVSDAEADDAIDALFAE